MCNATPQQMDMMEKTVRQFLDDGIMFTAYDVTIATREREDIQMRHKDVRGACHEISILSDACDFGWDDPNGGTVDWQRSQVSMSGGHWAFVYHPAAFDPQTYRPRDAAPTAKTSAIAPPSPVPTPTPNGNRSDSGGKTSDGSYETDYRKRLFIPTAFLKTAGMAAGDECVVVCDKDNKTIMLTADDSNLDGTVRITTQKVERNGDLRLSSTTLKAGDLDADKFVIENTDAAQTAVVKIGAKD